MKRPPHRPLKTTIATLSAPQTDLATDRFDLFMRWFAWGTAIVAAVFTVFQLFLRDLLRDLL